MVYRQERRVIKIRREDPEERVKRGSKVRWGDPNREVQVRYVE